MKVLMVCLGNICRSPTAEGVLREIAAREAPELFSAIDSAGIADYHIGEPPDRRSVAVAATRGYDISALRARQVDPKDFAEFDLLLAMDRSNLAALRAQCPSSADRAKLQLFLQYAPVAEGLIEVPDPYYGREADFDRVVDLCEIAARGLIEKLRGSGR